MLSGVDPMAAWWSRSGNGSLKAENWMCGFMFCFVYFLDRVGCGEKGDLSFPEAGCTCVALNLSARLTQLWQVLKHVGWALCTVVLSQDWTLLFQLCCFSCWGTMPEAVLWQIQKISSNGYQKKNSNQIPIIWHNFWQAAGWRLPKLEEVTPSLSC